MFAVFFCVAVALATADKSAHEHEHEPAPAPAPYSAPYQPPRPAYSAYQPARPSYKAPAEPVSPPVYQYNWDVNDHYSGNSYTANEARDGYATQGEYRIALPDGRTQIVTYSVNDARSGYHAAAR